MGEENVKDKFHEEEEKETMEEEAGVEDVDPGGLRFTQTLSELGADKLFKEYVYALLLLFLFFYWEDVKFMNSNEFKI